MKNLGQNLVNGNTEPPDAFRAPPETRLVLRTLGQRLRSTRHSWVAKWLMDNPGSTNDFDLVSTELQPDGEPVFFHGCEHKNPVLFRYAADQGQTQAEAWGMQPV